MSIVFKTFWKWFSFVLWIHQKQLVFFFFFLSLNFLIFYPAQWEAIILEHLRINLRTSLADLVVLCEPWIFRGWSKMRRTVALSHALRGVIIKCEVSADNVLMPHGEATHVPFGCLANRYCCQRFKSSVQSLRTFLCAYFMGVGGIRVWSGGFLSPPPHLRRQNTLKMLISRLGTYAGSVHM